MTSNTKNAANDAIASRKSKEQERILGWLAKFPIVQIACEKSGVGRTTYYAWRKQDPEFAKQADEAILGGEAVITDMNEAQLIALSRDKHFPAIMAWLKAHHPKYGDKVRIETTIREERPLTPKEQEFVKQALKAASFNVEDGTAKKPDNHG